MFKLYMYLSTLLILGFLLSILLRKKGFSSSISYLLAGVITSLILKMPDEVSIFLLGIGELAIILLVFEIGYEIRVEKIREIIGFPLYFTFLQCLLGITASLGIGIIFRLELWTTLIIGVITSFSSTVFTFKLLEDIKPSRNQIKDLIYMILLVEDIFIIIFLGLIETIDAPNIYQYLAPITIPIVMFTFSYEFTHKFLKKYLTGDENSAVLVIGYSLALGFLSILLGSSPAIGAFIAGLSFADINSGLMERIRSIRSFTLILFFAAIGTSISSHGVTIGMLYKAILFAIPIVIIHSIVTLIASILMSGQGILYGLETGFYLLTLSELGLIIVYKALEKNIIPYEIALASIISIIIASLISSYFVNSKTYLLTRIYRFIPCGLRESIGFLSIQMNLIFKSLKYNVLLYLFKNIFHIMGEIIILSILLSIIIDLVFQYIETGYAMYVFITIVIIVYTMLCYVIIKRSVRIADKIIDMVKTRRSEYIRKEVHRLIYALNIVLALTTITVTTIIMNYKNIYQYLGIPSAYILGLILSIVPIIIILILLIIEK